MIDHIDVIYAKNDTKLSRLIDLIQYVRKTKHDKDVANRTNVVYAETETELSGPIGLGVVCD